jgi:Tol biopolymer transport system component
MHRRRNEMKEGQGRALAMAVMLAVLGACTADPAADGSDASSQVASTQTASTTADVPVVVTGAFFLDLRTGEETPLPSTSINDSSSGVHFNEGRYYVASPDGSRVYWEFLDTGEGSAVARSDGSQGRRLDPTGVIDYYAGGWSLDGTRIVYQRRDGSGDDFGNLVVEDMASGRTTRITDLEQRTDDVDGWWYLAPTFSPDDRNVIFQWPRDSSSGTKWDLWSVPVTGGEPSLLVRNAAQATTSDGPIWAFVRPKSDFFDGSSLVIATPEGFRTLVEASFGIFEPKMSPDGSKIAYQDGGPIYVVDIATGESSEVAEGRMAAWLDDDTLIVAPEDQ